MYHVIQGDDTYLNDVRTSIRGSVTVKPCEGACEARDGNAREGRLSDDTPPTRRRLLNSGREEVREEQGLQLRVLLETGRDVTQENTADNATTSPHGGTTWKNSSTSKAFHSRLCFSTYRPCSSSIHSLRQLVASIGSLECKR